MDHGLMGEENAERQIKPVADGVVILADIFHANGHVEKQKLVQLYPDQLRWISTHLTGPHKYSQFVYEISEESESASRLDFIGLHLEYNENLDKAAIDLLAKKLRKEDSDAWRLLAKAMAKELGKHGASLNKR
jgi:hypothetical protein